MNDDCDPRRRHPGLEVEPRLSHPRPSRLQSRSPGGASAPPWKPPHPDLPSPPPSVPHSFVTPRASANTGFVLSIRTRLHVFKNKFLLYPFFLPFVIHLLDMACPIVRASLKSPMWGHLTRPSVLRIFCKLGVGWVDFTISRLDFFPVRLLCKWSGGCPSEIYDDSALAGVAQATTH